MDKYSTVKDFLDAQDATKREQIELLRSTILKAHAGLEEHIKWNAPSYVLNGVDRITFNVMNKDGDVKLILHFGATRKEDRKAAPLLADDKGLVTWISDIRGMMSFKEIAQIKAKKAEIKEVITRWLALT